MSVAPEPSSTTSHRVHWLTVHRGERLTLDSLHDNGVHAYGCLSTLGDDGAVITYIYLSKRCRQTAIARCLSTHESARIVDAPNETVLADTMEFQTLVLHLNEQNTHVFSDGVEFGYLSKLHQHATKPPSQLEDENEKLRARLAAMEKDYFDMEQRLRIALPKREKAQEMVRVLRGKLSTANIVREKEEAEIKRLHIENTEFRRSAAEKKGVKKLMKELMTLQDQHQEKVRESKDLEMDLCIVREDNAKLQAEAAMAPRPWNYLKK